MGPMAFRLVLSLWVVREWARCQEATIPKRTEVPVCPGNGAWLDKQVSPCNRALENKEGKECLSSVLHVDFWMPVGNVRIQLGLGEQYSWISAIRHGALFTSLSTTFHATLRRALWPIVCTVSARMASPAQPWHIFSDVAPKAGLPQA